MLAVWARGHGVPVQKAGGHNHAERSAPASLALRHLTLWLSLQRHVCALCAGDAQHTSTHTYTHIYIYTHTQVLAVHMCGDVAPEIMQLAGVAIKAGATKAHFDSTIGTFTPPFHACTYARARSFCSVCICSCVCACACVRAFELVSVHGPGIQGKETSILMVTCH